MNSQGTVWVLGASSGLGLATAYAFAEAGWLVIAGARSFATQQKTEYGNLHCLPLDATVEDSCQAFVQKALAIHPQVDVLCYAAGLLVLGACEETSLQQYQQVMQTNFLGMARMVAKVLPTMRAQGNGKLFLFSSLNGVIGVPFQSAYTASKHAIEGYAQCLAMETKPFGVSVCLVEPGDHQGGSQAYRLSGSNASGPSPYAREYDSTCQTIHRDEARGLSAQALGRKVEKTARRHRIPFKLRVAKLDQRAACWLSLLLPKHLFFAIMRSYYLQKG